MKTELKKDWAGETQCTISGRPKHYYSIYQKMILRGRDFEDIYDLIGIRVLVEEIRIVTRLWASPILSVPSKGGSRTISPPRSLTSTSRSTHYSYWSVAKPSRSRYARMTCTSARIWRGSTLALKENPNAGAFRSDSRMIRSRVAPPARGLATKTADPKEFLDSAALRDVGRSGLRLHSSGRVMELPTDRRQWFFCRTLRKSATAL